MSAEEGSQPKVPKIDKLEQNKKDNEEGGNFWISLNISRDTKLLEVIESVRSLRAELQSVKADNKGIMKTQKEINNVILNKLIRQEADEQEKGVSDRLEITSYKRKAKRKVTFCYDQNKTAHPSNWKRKGKENFQERKGNRYINNNKPRCNCREISSNGSQNLDLPKGKGRESVIPHSRRVIQREPLNCWEFGEPHYFKDCPSRKKKVRKRQTIQEATSSGGMAGSLPWIGTTSRNRSTEYPTSMMEAEGMITQMPKPYFN